MTFNQVATILAPIVRQKEVARALDVTDRTLRNWRKRTVPEDFPKLGRPAHDERAHAQAFWRVGREYLKQGRCGEPALAKALATAVPRRLLRAHLAAFRRCEERHKRRRIERHQVRVEVTAKNAFWVQDSAQVGRAPGGSKIEFQIIKDRGTLATVGVSTGGPTRSADVVTLLTQLKAVRGLPLVLGSDNGAPFVAGEVAEFLREEQVIHLRSLPRTPQQNGSAEIAVRELKQCSGLGAAAHLSYEAAHSRIVRAAHTLNKNRLRASKGLKSGVQLDEELAVGYHLVSRAQFYEECCRRIETAKQGVFGARAQRMAEREAIFSTMEEFGLVRRYRGGSQVR